MFLSILFLILARLWAMDCFVYGVPVESWMVISTATHDDEDPSVARKTAMIKISAGQHAAHLED